jgi:hypothetical protein
VITPRLASRTPPDDPSRAGPPRAAGWAPPHPLEAGLPSRHDSQLTALRASPRPHAPRPRHIRATPSRSGFVASGLTPIPITRSRSPHPATRFRSMGSYPPCTARRIRHSSLGPCLLRRARCQGSVGRTLRAVPE